MPYCWLENAFGRIASGSSKRTSTVDLSKLRISSGLKRVEKSGRPVAVVDGSRM
jgi:hypothetical protein